jgi:hypothetical protein
MARAEARICRNLKYSLNQLKLQSYKAAVPSVKLHPKTIKV